MSSSSAPPRFVPTLTEVVHPPLGTDEAIFSANGGAAQASVIELEAQLEQRVLQRVDLILEQRLREVIGQLILEHTQTLVPQLREAIDTLVRQSINQAFEHEIGQTLAQS
jgi:transcriptional regulator of heat shock response